MTDRTSFFITRALIGACEGGFIPGTILFASYFYKSRELSVRLAWFWSTLNIARVISSLLAAGILNMRGIGGKAGWFWLFLIEGLLTFVLGLMSYCYLPAAPTHTTGIFWRRPWYTEREEVIMTNVSLLVLLRKQISHTTAYPPRRPGQGSHSAQRANHARRCDPNLARLFNVGSVPRRSRSLYPRNTSVKLSFPDPEAHRLLDVRFQHAGYSGSHIANHSDACTSIQQRLFQREDLPLFLWRVLVFAIADGSVGYAQWRPRLGSVCYHHDDLGL